MNINRKRTENWHSSGHWTGSGAAGDCGSLTRIIHTLRLWLSDWVALIRTLGVDWLKSSTTVNNKLIVSLWFDTLGGNAPINHSSTPNALAFLYFHAAVVVVSVPNTDTPNLMPKLIYTHAYTFVTIRNITGRQRSEIENHLILPVYSAKPWHLVVQTKNNKNGRFNVWSLSPN